MEKAKPVFLTQKYCVSCGAHRARNRLADMQRFLHFRHDEFKFCSRPDRTRQYSARRWGGRISRRGIRSRRHLRRGGRIRPVHNSIARRQPRFHRVSVPCKGIAAGVVPALLYKLISRKSKRAAVIAAAVSAPIANTGLFILGGLVLSDVLSANFVADGTTVIYFLIVGCAGVNFLIEFAINLVLSPALYTVTRVVEKQISVHSKKRAADKAQ